jgi:hypothetical protein
MLQRLSICIIGLFIGIAGAAEPDAYQQWRATLFDTLERSNNADDYVALYLLAGRDADRVADRDDYLRRAYAVGKGNAKALWLIAIASPCSSECAQGIAAARDLTKTDPDNALAWLTLAYMAEQDAGATKEVSESLRRAARASRLHDYAFDLMKIMIATASRLPIPVTALYAAPTRPRSMEEFWLQQSDSAVPVASRGIMAWVEHGCTSHADSDNAVACEAAKLQRQHGDSLITLGPASDGGMRLQEDMRVMLSDPDMAIHAKMKFDAFAASTDERDFLERVAASLRR